MKIPVIFLIGSTALLRASVGTGQSVSMTLKESAKREWCWAAVTQGVETAYKEAPERQCMIATRVFKQTGSLGCNGKIPAGAIAPPDCCANQNPCNCTQELRFALGVHHGSKQSGNNPELVQSQIDHDTCVPARVYSAGSGHYVVIGGYWNDSSGDSFEIWDPSDVTGSAPRKVPVSEFTDNYYQAGWIWDETYITVP